MASTNKVAITTYEGGDTKINAAEAAGGIVIGGTAWIGAELLINDVPVAVDASGRWTTTLPVLADGSLLVRAVASDAAGGRSTATKTLTVDTQAPAVAITAIEGGDAMITAAEAAGGIVIEGTAEVGSTVKVNGKSAAVDAGGHWSIALKPPPQDGDFVVSAVAKDAFGNTSSTSTTLLLARKGPALAITELEGGDAKINAAEAAGGIVLGGTAEIGSTLKVNGAAVTVDGNGHWTTTLAAPAGDGPLVVNAIAHNASGNTTTSTKTLTVDTAPPTVTVTTIEGGDATISAAEATGGILVGGTAEAGSTLRVNGTAVAVAGDGQWTTTLAAPAGDGPLVVTAAARDGAGNTATATTTLQVDTAPPTVAITTIEGGDTTISAAEARGGIVVGGTAEIGSTLQVNGAAVAVAGDGHWTTTLAAPAQQGPLMVTAVARDAAGNEATSATTLTVNAPRVFDVRDFGATANDATVDSAAINAAIRAANAAGGGTVYIPAGTFIVAGDHDNPSAGAIELLSNVHLRGAGMGQTVLKLQDGFNDRINGIVRTPLGERGETIENVTLTDLTVDGNRAGQAAVDRFGEPVHQAGFISGAKEDGSGRLQRDIMIDHVEIMNCTAYGFDPHEVTYNITIQNSTAHHNALDGFTADALIDSVFRNNVAYDNDRHGFNVQNATSNFVLLDNIAYGNGTGATGGAGITVQRGDLIPDFPIGGTHSIWNHDVRIIGGEYHHNSRQGILIKLSDMITVDGANVHDNGREGVRVEGATNTVIMNSTIHDNSTESPGSYDAVSIRERYDDVLDETVYSTNTWVHDNDIYATTSPSRYGIREEVTNATLPDGSSSGTVLTDDPGTTRSDNQIAGMASGSISVPGYLVTFTGTEGSDTLTGTSESDRLVGLGGNDLLLGGDGTDALDGGAGNDTLDGGTRADTMSGGQGDDIYYVDHTGDVVAENAGEGTDRVIASINYTLGDNVENLTLAGTTTLNGYGNALDNRLTGNSGANVLKALDGADTLDGGAGADSMTGGNGNDTYFVDDLGDQVIESQDNGLGGIDTVLSTVSYTLADQVENLTLLGAGDLTATGNGLANVLTGNAGNNVLDGGGGADTLAGGLGNDTYLVDHTGDLVVEGAGAGTDGVVASINYTLGDNVENLTLTGTANLNAAGNALDNRLTGNAGANVLKALDGADTLDGGAGADSMTGGNGNDTYYVDDAGDLVFESLNGGLGGTDTVFSTVSYTLSDQVERLVLTGTANLTATGNGLANVLSGNAGNNVLDGGAGADTMRGGAGDDTYRVDHTGDVVAENAGEGLDTVVSSISYVLGDSFEYLTLAGTANLNATGNALDNVLTGNGGSNKLEGGLGQDLLVGGAGADTFVFRDVGSSPAGSATRDAIGDFVSGVDRIDLQALDGNSQTSTFEHLIWGGQSQQAQSHAVTWSFDGNGRAIVQADVSGDGVADLEIALNTWTSTRTLQASDFNL